MSHSPNFQTAYSITQEVLQKTALQASMPLSSVLKLISEIYVSILFDLKLNVQNTSKAGKPLTVGEISDVLLRLQSYPVNPHGSEVG